MEEIESIINSKYEGQIKEDHYSGRSLASKILSAVLLGGVVVALIVFYKAFTPSAYDADLYTYNVDLSTMKDITSEVEICEEFTAKMNELPSGETVIDSELHSYVDGWNGYKNESITIREDGICSKDITVKVGIKTEKSSEYDLLYQNEYELVGLNRLYKSATGYVGIFNFVVDNEKLGKLNMTAHIYADRDMNKLAEAYVGKSLSTGIGVYKKYNTYNIESLMNKQSINGLMNN